MSDMTLAERIAKVCWPEGVSDGLILACTDCDIAPRFDYSVDDDFWKRWAPNERGVICLPCLDRRCEGEGLGEALQEVQWTGTGHTAILSVTKLVRYDAG